MSPQFPLPDVAQGLAERTAIEQFKSISPQLYAAIDAKLLRIQSTLWGSIYWLDPACHNTHLDLDTRRRNSDYIREAYASIERCRREVRYEYLGLKDSWL